MNEISLMDFTEIRAHRNWTPEDDGIEMVLAHVPESEHLTYDEALALAEKRDEQAADAFVQSVPSGVFPYTYDAALRKRLADSGVLVSQMIPAQKALRRVWMPSLMLSREWTEPT